MPPTESSAPPCSSGFAPYRWTWHYFQLGLRDYLRERLKGRGALPSALPSTPPQFLKQLVGVLAIVVVISVVAGALVPLLAPALGAAGVPLLTIVGALLIALAAFALLVALPLYLGVKGYRFAHRMACRGWLIEQKRLVATQKSIV
jgi:hypothetical protein